MYFKALIDNGLVNRIIPEATSKNFALDVKKKVVIALRDSLEREDYDNHHMRVVVDVACRNGRNFWREHELSDLITNETALFLLSTKFYCLLWTLKQRNWLNIEAFIRNHKVMGKLTVTDYVAEVKKLTLISKMLSE